MASVTSCSSRLLLGLLLLLALMLGLSLSFGSYRLSLADIGRFIGQYLGGEPLPEARRQLIYQLLVEIRLPRALGAVLVGAALATSGAAFQGIFRNPLVSPNLLGVLSGSAFGAALTMLLGQHWLVVQLAAFAGGLLAVAMAVLIATVFGRGSLIILILGGILSGALFAALLSLLKYLADPFNQLPSLMVWLMGSLASISLADLTWMAPIMLLAIAALCLSGRRLDALAMGDDQAASLGIAVNASRYLVILWATLLGALTVSLAGIVGWVGLIVPHLLRLLAGPNHSRLLPGAALLGASFLLAADLLARSLGSNEIPIGLITELLGIPVFIVVLGRATRAWGE